MSAEAADLWSRARRSLQSARLLAVEDPDACASRAYYAAFYAMSALFALRGKTFTKHTALEAAVHRDLVRGEHWPPATGADYTALQALRTTGDYGGKLHVRERDAAEAVAAAERILEAVRVRHPNDFT
ncbi:MAG TPA: HEPN domain-containing protein [Polyangia bacterium]|jgi:uncharacterized protein (UPF0332 family)